jgi:hypothetical protein
MKKTICMLLFLFIVVAGFAQQSDLLSKREKDAITYMREEEKMARDVYDSMFNKWKVNPFGNIRKSEQVHMNRMEQLINTYQLQDPVKANGDRPGIFTDALMKQYYQELIVLGSKTFTDALRAGGKIEELDIHDLDQRINETRQQDIIVAYEFLRNASYNHLRAFVRRLKMDGIIYEPEILSKQSFDTIIAGANGSMTNH